MNIISTLDHSYGTHIVFEKMRVELPDTGTVALRGPNGCGKTTLLKLLGGVIQTDSEHVITWRKSRHAVYMDSEYLTLEYLTVEETLAALRPLMVPGREGNLPLISRSMPATRLGDLSLGQRQRLVLTIALSLETPQILLLDEPLNGLDTAACDTARRLTREHGRNHLVVLATHESERWTEYELLIDSPSTSQLSTTGAVR